MSEAIDGTIRPFPGAAIIEQPTRCLNARHSAAGCSQCVTNCPVDAVQLVNGKPVLNQAQCINCGICLQSCPTEVFTQADTAESHLIRTVDQLPHHPITLVCALHPKPHYTKAPATTIVQHRRCLAALGVEQLLALSEDGERAVWLDDNPCATCPLQGTSRFLHAQVKIANTLLEAFGRSAGIFLQSERAELLSAEAAPRPWIDSGNPPVSRRGLFVALGRAIKPQGAPATLGVDSQLHVGSARLPQRIPTTRTTLLARMQRWTHPTQEEITGTALPFADVQVNSASCSGCGLCARFCPTGALQFSSEATQFRLSFQAAICIDCPICTVACPEAAIRIGDTLAPATLGTKTWLPLLEGGLTSCQQCGVPTATSPHERTPARCYACRQGAGVVQPLRDDAGLMADLLSRSAKIEKLGGD